MTISVPEMISLGAYFVLMMAIGLYAYRESTSDVSEYMLGGRNLHPAVGALSAGASDMSGWIDSRERVIGTGHPSAISASWGAIPTKRRLPPSGRCLFRQTVREYAPGALACSCRKGESAEEYDSDSMIHP